MDYTHIITDVIGFCSVVILQLVYIKKAKADKAASEAKAQELFAQHQLNLDAKFAGMQLSVDSAKATAVQNSLKLDVVGDKVDDAAAKAEVAAEKAQETSERINVVVEKVDENTALTQDNNTKIQENTQITKQTLKKVQ